MEFLSLKGAECLQALVTCAAAVAAWSLWRPDPWRIHLAVKLKYIHLDSLYSADCKPTGLTGRLGQPFLTTASISF